MDKSHDVFTIKGTLTDFKGTPLKGGEVSLKKGPTFENVVSVESDENGAFELEAPKGDYIALYACKDYKTKFLEFWYWDIPSDRDHSLDIKIDGLEVYGIKAWKTYSGALVYFRPMSLKKYKGLGNPDKSKPALIAPDLTPKDLKVLLNGKHMDVWGLNKVKEHIGSEDSYMDAYLAHVEIKDYDFEKNYEVCLEIHDSETNEYGQGCAPLQAIK